MFATPGYIIRSVNTKNRKFEPGILKRAKKYAPTMESAIERTVEITATNVVLKIFPPMKFHA